jgi:hypothetical protein
VHSKNHVVKFTRAKTYSVLFQKPIESKILCILTLIVHISRVRIVVNARMRIGVFIPKVRPNGREFESPSGQITIFPKNYTRNVKSMQNAVKSTVTVFDR